MNFSFEAIGTIHSCFKEKFGIPRQPGLVPDAEAHLEILPPYNRAEAFRELEGYSHLWILFVFHAALRSHWSPTVRPPRLGGNRRVGVFATRSPFRPNPIGLSAVALQAVEYRQEKITLRLRGVDLLDGTPVLDIKPYLPYADAIRDARAGFASDVPARAVPLSLSEEAENFLAGMARTESEHLRRLIRQIIDNDPRPAYRQQDDSGGEYGMRLYDLNIRWQVLEEGVRITRIQSLAGDN